MRVLVVDDDAAARRRLVRLLGELGQERVAEALDWEQALEQAREQEPELVLMDMAMPGHDGLWITKKLGEMQLESRVVFVTAQDEYAVEIMEREKYDYLIKPVQREELEYFLNAEADEKTGLASDEEYHSVRKGKEQQRLLVKDIWFFKTDGKLVLAFDGMDEHPIELSLKQLQQRYGERFVRIHRHYLVDCHRIERLDRDRLGGTRLWLRGYDRPLPVSSRLVLRVRSAMSC
ncbi:MAG: LytTR family DNA-binding domain-containing protein [Gammaproteobacteria bacterium]|nr:LytTR family DNA-binding domain-containing protein [Gammaproteobacteria bacterium]